MIVLDTHTWLWWAAAPDRLSEVASSLIRDADAIGISSISAWEVVMLSDRGRIALDRPAPRWISSALGSDPRIESLPLDTAVAIEAAGLGARGMHGDPADRFIYATAQRHRAVLVTRDAALQRFDPDGTAW